MDKKSVEEKQILVNMMAQEGYLLIGDIAVSKQKELLKNALVASANKDKNQLMRIYKRQKNGKRAVPISYFFMTL